MAHSHPTASSAGRDPTRLAQLKQQWSVYQRDRALKTTSQRELIVDVFLRGTEHVSIEELLGEVRRRSAKVGYATVYRTLKLLEEAGLAAARHFGDGQTRYEVAGSEAPHHDHLICVRCGLILEFENNQIEQLQDAVAEKLGGFKVVNHKLELYVLCPKEQGLAGGACPNEEQRRRGSRGRPAHGKGDPRLGA